MLTDFLMVNTSVLYCALCMGSNLPVGLILVATVVV